MSGGGSGGGMTGMIQNLYSQLPQGVGGSGSYPGMAPGHGGLASPAYTPGPSFQGPAYGQLGSYNTLAQDLARGQTGAFQFGGPGQSPFSYMPGGEASGRRGPSGYTGIGPFQNQGGGALPTDPQTSLGSGSWPGFGQGGMPGYGYGGGYTGFPQYGGAYGGSGYGMQGSPFFRGPGSYSSPGSMPYGGGGGFQSGYFDRARQRGMGGFGGPFTPGMRRPGTPTGITIGGYGGGATTGQESLPPDLQNPQRPMPDFRTPPGRGMDRYNMRKPFMGDYMQRSLW